VSHAGRWGEKASNLYRAEYARKYREHDDELDGVAAYRTFCDWLSSVCARFDHPIDVLDVGCGTGRYFRALSGVRSLVGIDASAAMLAEARHPVGAERITAASIELVQGDIVTQGFDAGRFDLIYSVGVLAEHTPLDAALVEKIRRWLRPQGRFAFTAVHPDSPSVRRTIGRTLGRLVLPVTAGTIRQRLHDRITAAGLYADEMLVRSRLEPQFAIESLTRVESEAHLHCLCVARKAAA
jgi:SAM-dependent methyltransferase